MTEECLLSVREGCVDVIPHMLGVHLAYQRRRPALMMSCIDQQDEAHDAWTGVQQNIS